MSYLCLDLETGSREYHGRTGNPWYNDIVAIGFKGFKEDVDSIYISNQDSIEDILCSTLPNYKVLVGHNIKYDLLYLWKYENLQKWLLRGGKIWDTQLAEYILTYQQHKYPALRDIAVNKYGCNERTKYMEEYWDKGIDTKDIPKELVIQDVENDVLDTEKIMLNQVFKAKKEGMYLLISLLMDSLLATTEMEYNGLYINKEIFNENRNRLKERLLLKYEEANQIAERYWK